MNAAMSSRRSFGSVRHGPVETSSVKSLPIVAFIGGFILLALGIKYDVTVLAAVGFIAFVTTLMYFNSMFWAKMFDSGKMGKDFSRSWMNKYL